MSQSLREKLSRIYGPTRDAATVTELQNRLEKLSRPRSPRSLADYLGGEWRERPSGRLLVAERLFPADHHHGILALSEVLTVAAPPVRTLAGGGFESFNPRRALFLDTETTGLAGGAGTCVFLVGLGYFDGDQFRTRQLFLPGYEAERAFLEELNEILLSGNFDCLVSFNGKSYDLNLLENRFVMQRLPRPFAGLDHLDLIHPSRLLWKGRLQDCALQTLERRLLRFHRHGDIPSALIPGIYFRYLHSGQFRLFSGVFEHNRLDLLTMVGLVALASRLVEDPDESHFVDHATVARIHQLRGDLGKAERLLDEALRRNGDIRRHCDWVLNLARVKKKLGKFDEALPLFLKVVEESPEPPLEAFEEAAKILEHVHHNFQAALDLVRRAMPLHAGEDLNRRVFRLDCRIAGKNWRIRSSSGSGSPSIEDEEIWRPPTTD